MVEPQMKTPAAALTGWGVRLKKEEDLHRHESSFDRAQDDLAQE